MTPISPAEIMLSRLQNEIDTAIVGGGVVVGPADDAQQQAGCISLSDAGLPKQERYLPLIWVRTQIRVLAPTLISADRIARHVYELLNGQGRSLVLQPSTGETFLVHMTNISSGPQSYFDTSETWEELLFAESLIGTEAVSTP